MYKISKKVNQDSFFLERWQQGWLHKRINKYIFLYCILKSNIQKNLYNFKTARKFSNENFSIFRNFPWFRGFAVQGDIFEKCF